MQAIQELVSIFVFVSVCMVFILLLYSFKKISLLFKQLKVPKSVYLYTVVLEIFARGKFRANVIFRKLGNVSAFKFRA